MFKKTRCANCGSKIDEKYSYCPHCGNRVNSGEGNNNDWGMLGKDDFTPFNNIKLPMGFNSLFNSLMNNLSKEFDEQFKKNYFGENPNANQNANGKQPKKTVKKDGLSITISTFGNGPPKIKVTPLGQKVQKIQPEKEIEKIKPNTFTKERMKKFSGSKKEEPKTNIKRLSDRIVYELNMPGVKSIDDVSIIKLEDSIEVKAVSKSKAYEKRIPLNLPITNYDLSEGKLTLELGIRNQQ